MSRPGDSPAIRAPVRPRLTAALAWAKWVVLAASAAVVALPALVSHAAAGHAKLLRVFLDRLPPVVDGTLSVDSIGPGSLLAGVTLHRVEVLGPDGRLHVRVDSVRARYSLVAALGLGGRREISDLRIWSPVVELSGARDDPGARPPAATPEARPSAAPPDSPAPRGDHPGSSLLRIGRLTIRDGALGVGGARGGQSAATAVSADIRGVELSWEREFSVGARVDDLALRFRARPGRELEVSDVEADLEVVDGAARIELERLRILKSEMSGEVEVTIGDGPRAARAELDVSGLALEELRWLDERLPPGRIGGDVAVAVDGGVTEIELAGVRLEADGAQFELHGGATIGDRFRLRDLRATEVRVATGEVRRWLTAMPAFGGVIEGEIRVDGLPGRLSVDGDLAVVDGATREIRGRARGGGTVRGARSFERIEVEVSSLDYRLLQHFAPDVNWGGRGELGLVAEGDLRDGMAIRIFASQRLGEEPASVFEVAGTVFGDTAIAAVELDATLAPLSLDAVRRQWPTLPATGLVEGSVSLEGTVEDLRFDASLTTPGGDLAARGRLNGRDWAAGYELDLSTERLDLAEILADAGAPRVVSGHVALTGSGLDPSSLQGDVTLAVGRSRIGRLELDTVALAARVGEDGVLRLEELVVEAGGVAVTGRGGSLGVAPGTIGGGLLLRVASSSIHRLRPFLMSGNPVAWDELTPFEQESLRLEGADEDTFPGRREIRFDGVARGTVNVAGNLHDARADVALDLERLAHRENAARSVTVAVAVSGISLVGADSAAGPNPRLALGGEISGDSVVLREREFRNADLKGRFELGSGGRLHARVARAEDESYEALAEVVLGEKGGRLNLDRLNFVFSDRRWSLQGPASVEWTNDYARVSHFGLIRPGAPGLRLFADGVVARGAGAEGRSNLEIGVTGLDLEVVGRLLQTGQTSEGLLAADLVGVGTGASRQWTGSLRLEDARHRGLSADSVVGYGSYRAGSVTGDLDLWTDGRRALRVEGTLPMPLGDDDAASATIADSVDLEIVVDALPAGPVAMALTRLEDVRGTLSGSVAMSGRRPDVEAVGTLRLDDATAFLPTQGLRLFGVVLEARLGLGGAIALSGMARSGDGELRLGGSIDLGSADDVVALDLAFWPRNFQVANTPHLSFAATGDSVTLTGTHKSPLLAGELEASNGTVFLEEFERASEMVDFYDPVMFRAAKAGLGSGDREDEPEPTVGGQFKRNLVVQLELKVGRGNWLRSRVMNVEPVGQLSVAFDRNRGQPVLEGEIEVVRGTYSLGPRAFTMSGGSFLFVGTPGFNPGITLTAENRLRSRDGEPLVITVDISGTLLSPHLSLSSDAEYPVSESDLYGYILFGRPTSALMGQVTDATVGVGRDVLVGQFVNQLGYLLTQELNVDHLSVSQSEQSGDALGASSVQVELGWYVLENIFLTGVYQRGFCADPTLPVASGGVRVEVAMPAEVRLEGFMEGRCTRQRYRGFGDLSLELSRIWGVEFFREWGY